MMEAIFSQISRFAVLVFALSSMLSVGLGNDFKSVFGPLRDVRALYRILVANFVLTPLLAVAIVHLIPLRPAHAMGLFILGLAAGAPFLIKLGESARADLALCAALLVVLAPVTAVYLPVVVPLAVQHPAVSGLKHNPVDAATLARPLFWAMIAPLAAGLLFGAIAKKAARRVQPIFGQLGSVALGAIIVSTFLTSPGDFLRILGTGALPAAILLFVGAYFLGNLTSGRARERRIVLGLGTAQRNIAACMIVATQGFNNPEILVMVTASSLIGLVVLFGFTLVLRGGASIGIPGGARA